MAEISSIKLEGRIFIDFEIVAQTGLHIGGSDTGIEIGGVDKTVIRDPLSNRPYIPGSSLRGKMRSLLEKYRGLPQNQRIGRGRIHSCQRGQRDEYQECDVCQIFGVPGEIEFSVPTRLVVRDVPMTDDSGPDAAGAHRSAFHRGQDRGLDRPRHLGGEPAPDRARAGGRGFWPGTAGLLGVCRQRM